MKDFYYDDVNSSIKIKNDRKGKCLIRVVMEDDADDFVIEKHDKPDFIDWLKRVIKDLEKG